MKATMEQKRSGAALFGAGRPKPPTRAQVREHEELALKLREQRRENSRLRARVRELELNGGAR